VHSVVILDVTRRYPYAPVPDLTDTLVTAARSLAFGEARQVGWFWLPCPLCGMYFSGKEWGPPRAGVTDFIPVAGRPGLFRAICPPCAAAGRGASRPVRFALDGEGTAAGAEASESP
jgi:hypothetical protein